jgi:hypothetical protein
VTTEGGGRRPETYLGDGVYASFDGYYIWLRADGPNAGDVNRIALEPVVYAALVRYESELASRNGEDTEP